MHYLHTFPAGPFEFLSAHKNVSNQQPDVFAKHINARNINFELSSSFDTSQIYAIKFYTTLETIN